MDMQKRRTGPTVGRESRVTKLECRRCGAQFKREAPKPYRTICPYCVARGSIVTLTPPDER